MNIYQQSFQNKYCLKLIYIDLGYNSFLSTQTIIKKNIPNYKKGPFLRRKLIHRHFFYEAIELLKVVYQSCNELFSIQKVDTK